MPYSLDANHAEIVRAFEKLGALVIDNARVSRREAGQPDICVGFYNPGGGVGLWVWVEIKTETGKLRPGQSDFIEDCQNRGLPVEVVKNTADVEAVYQKYLEIMR